MAPDDRLQATAAFRRAMTRRGWLLTARGWQWLGLAVGLVAFGLLLADEAWHGPVSSADQGVYDGITAWQESGFPANAIGETVSRPVSVPWAVAITAVVVVAWWLLRDRRMAVVAAVSGLVAGAAIYGLKQTIKRPLPPKAAGAWYGYSFPSGHTISAVANVGLLLLLAAQFFIDRRRSQQEEGDRLWRWAVVAWVVWAIAMGIARILTQRHWAADVYASWAIGLALACATLLAARVPRPPALHEPKREDDGQAPAAPSGLGPAS